MQRTDLPASASTFNHVKIFARLWGILGVNGRHELLEDHERRQPQLLPHTLVMLAVAVPGIPLSGTEINRKIM